MSLKRHGHADQAVEINQAAVRIAREAFGGREGYVLGDIGPLGPLMEPYGDLSREEGQAALEEQAKALVDAGADAIIIETQTSLDEMGLAIDAAKGAGSKCIIASLAYDLSQDKTFYVTMMGVMPDQAAQFVEERGGHIIALNCGTGMDMVGAASVARQYRGATKLPTMVQPNAGLPVLEKGKAVYKQTPEDMVKDLPQVIEAGANIIGSCCGSTPEHTRAIHGAVEAFNRSQRA